MALTFDCETNGFLHEATVCHCLSIHDSETDIVTRYTGARIMEGIRRLLDAELIIAHNGIAFDVPVLEKLYGVKFDESRVFDTLVISRLIFTDLRDRDFQSKTKSREFMQAGLVGKHSLEAWGWRLGDYKGDFKPEKFTNPETGEPHSWATIPYTEEMGEYCDQDVVVTVKLYRHLLSKGYSATAIGLEHEVQWSAARMMAHGFHFNERAAVTLYGELAEEREVYARQLREEFGCWYVGKETTPKRTMKRWVEHEEGAHDEVRRRTINGAKVVRTERGYFEHTTSGAPYSKLELVEFNAGSRDHIADRLMTLHGWKPKEWTDTGKPKVDETTLEGLDYPAAKLCHEYLVLVKKIGQLAEGKNAWLKHCRDGRIHGAVNTNGTRTGRMSHFAPNVAQVDKDHRMRSLFMADRGHILVGADASGLELRMLGHFLARWDGGAYALEVVDGDIHTANQLAVGLNDRNSAKTFIYALIYGGGDEKLGAIVFADMDDTRKKRFLRVYKTRAARRKGLVKIGREARAKMVARFPALGELTKAAQKRYRRLRGIDGRYLLGSSKHAAVNTVLQSAGALVMKKAIVLFDQRMQAAGHRWGQDFAIVAMVHDEIQVTCREEIAADVEQFSVEAIREAGRAFDFRCPLDGESQRGSSWADTH